jgi:predicted  nucleic acid-binding Zn-ribbon protein
MNYPIVENLKLNRNYPSFISSLKGVKVRLNRNEAFLHLKQLSGVLENVVLKLTINEDLTVNVEQTEGDPCSIEQITRIINDFDFFKTMGYAEKYIIGNIEFKDSNGDLCYLEVEQLRPIDKLRSILDELNNEPSDEVFKEVKDVNKVNSLIDDLFSYDEEVAEQVTNQGMKLTSELKDRIETYFNNVDPVKLVDDLVENFGAVEIKEEKVPSSYLLDSFNKMKEVQKNELQKRIDDKEKELVKLSNELNSTNSKIKKAESDLDNLKARLSSYDEVDSDNGYSFSISQAINTPIEITEQDEELLKKVSSNLQMPYDMFKKFVTESSFKIYIKPKDESLDITKAYEKIYLIDPMAKIDFVEDGVVLYKGKMKWHDLVDSMIRKGFKQDPDLDRQVEEEQKEQNEEVTE